MTNHATILRRKISLSVAVLLFCTGAAYAQSNLSGYWDLRVPNGDGTFRETFFQLTQDGGKLTGKWFGRDSNGVPMEGSVEGGKIT